jgi:hypothetical protein
MGRLLPDGPPSSSGVLSRSAIVSILMLPARGSIVTQTGTPAAMTPLMVRVMSAWVNVEALLAILARFGPSFTMGRRCACFDGPLSRNISDMSLVFKVFGVVMMFSRSAPCECTLQLRRKTQPSPRLAFMIIVK